MAHMGLYMQMIVDRFVGVDNSLK